MKKKIKLIALGIAIVIILGTAAWYSQTLGNKATAIRVACIGDSITEAFGYPEELSVRLGVNYTVGNFGVGGSTVSISSLKPYIYQTTFQYAKNFQPHIVVIMLGANDALPSNHKYNASFVEDYIALVEEFEALESKPEIWIVKPPPIFNDGQGLSTEFYAETVIPNVEAVANQTNLPAINVYSALMDYPQYLYDGVHPNAQGAKVIADEVYKAIVSQQS